MMWLAATHPPMMMMIISEGGECNDLVKISSNYCLNDGDEDELYKELLLL